MAKMSNAATANEPTFQMSREDYRAWAASQPSGRFERMSGVVVAVAPERAAHNTRKMAAWLALHRAVQGAGLPCFVYGDGMTVEVDDSDYEPDVVMHCGAKLPGEAVAVPDPLLIIDVLSPSTNGIDRAWKLKEYFRLPSLRHYLIVWPDRQQIAHHQRTDSGGVDTRTITNGVITLQPPGISIALEDIYAG
jgi:Uma2 family endonuclease